MNPVTQAALLGSSFAIGTAILFVGFFRFALPRLRSRYLVLFGICVVFLLSGPIAVIQLPALMIRAGITDPVIRDVGSYIHVLTLIASLVYALIQGIKWNKQHGEGV